MNKYCKYVINIYIYILIISLKLSYFKYLSLMADISFLLKNVLKNYCLSQSMYYSTISSWVLLSSAKEKNAQKVAFSEIKNTNFDYSLHDKLAPRVMKLKLEIIKNKLCLFFEYSIIVCEGGRCYLTLRRPLCR